MGTQLQVAVDADEEIEVSRFNKGIKAPLRE
jgi:hypothetical protein